MPQHTPGPWQIMTRDSVGDNIFTESKPHRRIANTYGDAEEYIANARLIAAAPDLLAALERIVAKYEAAPDGPLGCGFVNGDFFAARAAITKARGEVTA